MTFPVQHPHKITQGFKTGHLGIDIAPVPAGTQGVEVLSPENATVIASGNRPSLEGQYLKLQGDSGMYYYFGHFASRLVSVGQRVSEGQAIGIMGMTGLATGIHTHHEVRTTSNDGQVDPIKFYKEGEDMKATPNDLKYLYLGVYAEEVSDEKLANDPFVGTDMGVATMKVLDYANTTGVAYWQVKPQLEGEIVELKKKIAELESGSQFVETKVYVKK